MGRTATLLVGLGFLTVSACSGSADPSPAPPPTASSSAPAPMPSPSPTPPVIPEAAKAHTEAGAKAFVEYFLLEERLPLLDELLHDPLERDRDLDVRREIVASQQIESVSLYVDRIPVALDMKPPTTDGS